MASLEGPVGIQAVRTKQIGVYSLSFVCPSVRAMLVRNETRRVKLTLGSKSRVTFGSGTISNNCRRCTLPKCSLSSPSNGKGSSADNFDENDEDYVNSSVVEAVEVKSGSDGLIIKMRDGRHLRCVQNNPQAGSLPDYAPHPAIVLKMEDGTGLLLPIIVLEMPSVLLMAAVRNVPIARPTMYQVVKEMVDKMGYEVRLARVTKRVHEAYFAQLYLSKMGNDDEFISFDLRPSDAINIAVRCKAPIQVSKYLANSDGMKVVESGRLAQLLSSDGPFFTELDRPNDQPCLVAEELLFVSNMMAAAGEERYQDAAQWRDKLDQFRADRNPKHTAE